MNLSLRRRRAPGRVSSTECALSSAVEPPLHRWRLVCVHPLPYICCFFIPAMRFREIYCRDSFWTVHRCIVNYRRILFSSSVQGMGNGMHLYFGHWQLTVMGAVLPQLNLTIETRTCKHLFAFREVNVSDSPPGTLF